MVETVGSLRSQPLKGKELRKTNKPLMEKRRRARINTCLNQLKSLVLQAMNKDSSQYSKLEKADILEMTVNFLKAVPHQKARTASQETVNGMAKYNTGFNECASEVARYLGSAHGLDNQVRSRVLSHLSQRVTAINGQPPAHTATTSQPALQPVYVQIPNTTQPIPGVHTAQGYPVNAPIPPSATALSSAKSQGALVVMPGAVVVPTPVSMNQEQQWFAHQQQQQQQNFVMPLSPASSTSSSRGPSPSISATPSPVHSHPSAQQGVQSSLVPTNVEAQRDQLWRPW